MCKVLKCKAFLMQMQRNTCLGFNKLLFFPSKNNSDKHKTTNHILMTVLAGKAAIGAQEMEDKEIVERCLTLLKSMFPDKVLPALLVADKLIKTSSTRI